MGGEEGKGGGKGNGRGRRSKRRGEKCRRKGLKLGSRALEWRMKSVCSGGEGVGMVVLVVAGKFGGRRSGRGGF
ncbi:hypothetical protein F3Y22_tig00112347pilonHSYRG00070 [Hibiscus syriacus]|uniref:Uncharacterized protein n=1 Tax=Hibiscus syriacus TaxID=106335 RepID=A0A6A2X109_HIBSY|nr:hypothetical protein F3Y22_tig00112347pilonHSYRG00070 [Hibiscus syriacus]